jgi:GDP-D-mannose dehydratase
MPIVGAVGTALITGASGQDGYYLSELLQHNGFEVHVRRWPRHGRTR